MKDFFSISTATIIVQCVLLQEVAGKCHCKNKIGESLCKKGTFKCPHKNYRCIDKTMGPFCQYDQIQFEEPQDKKLKGIFNNNYPDSPYTKSCAKFKKGEKIKVNFVEEAALYWSRIIFGKSGNPDNIDISDCTNKKRDVWRDVIDIYCKAKLVNSTTITIKGQAELCKFMSSRGRDVLRNTKKEKFMKHFVDGDEKTCSTLSSLYSKDFTPNTKNNVHWTHVIFSATRSFSNCPATLVVKSVTSGSKYNCDIFYEEQQFSCFNNKIKDTLSSVTLEYTLPKTRCTQDTTICSFAVYVEDKCEKNKWGAGCKAVSSCNSYLSSVTGRCVGGVNKDTIDHKKCKNCMNGKCQTIYGACADCKPGYFGESCGTKCSGNCKQCTSRTKCKAKFTKADCKNCLSGKCKNGDCAKCKPEYSGVRCLIKCLKKCKKCTNETSCSELYTDEDCKNCLNGKCNTLHMTCTDCKPGFFGERCERKCKNVCKKCTNTTDCTALYTEDDCKNCMNEKCNAANMTCTDCKPGFFGKRCDNKCSSVCTSCTSKTNCKSCRLGFQGGSCDQQCSSSCSYGLCHDDGKCASCNSNAFYGDHCQKACAFSQCDKLGNEVTACEEGFHGVSCTLPCSKNCVGGKCDAAGLCYNCTEGYYGFYCERKCSGCAICTRKGVCLSRCFTGFYGEYCDKRCSKKCFGAVCASKTGDCTMCDAGFYGHDCSKKCPLSDTCDMDGNASDSECDQGYYSDEDNDCSLKCSKFCESGTCSQTGVCKNCAKGYYDLMCDKKCVGCDECDRTGACTSDCMPGFWGTFCDKPCSRVCLFHNCDRKTGNCRECEAGKHGVECDSSCEKVCDIEGQEFKSDCPTGKYGELCQNNCSSNCDTFNCTRNLGTCFSCPSGQYGYKCEFHCPRCSICSRLGTCLSDCFPGYFGEGCDKSCSYCLRGQCHKNGTCKECNTGFHGELCDKECPLKEICDISGAITKGCPKSTYGENCDKSCNTSCRGQLCSMSTGVCLACEDGYFGLQCEQKCTNCWECDQSGTCTSECTAGYYGERCNKPCAAKCLLSLCEKDTGICVECELGYYGSFCNFNCTTGTECDNTGADVRQCDKGTTGPNCDIICSASCRDYNCTSQGTCLACVKGFYGLKCNESCLGCNLCTRDGFCISDCFRGHYGESCEHTCSEQCFGGICSQNGSCYECKQGYFGKDCNFPCPDGKACHKNGKTMTQCKIGTYGENCEKKCHKNCENFKCNSHTGTCFDCKKGFTGKLCELKCPYCDECERNGKCNTECYPGQYGEFCDIKCNLNCLNGNCDRNGVCLECAEGFFGPDCLSKCRSELCDIDGNYLEVCQKGYWGENCDKTCSKNCLDFECTPVLGNCKQCKEGFFGLQCEYDCYSCEQCNIKGVCESECFPGLYKSRCENKCSEKCFLSNCFKNGRCLECPKGSYGDECQNNCSGGGYCDQKGNPLTECGKGFYGVSCNDTCSENCKGINCTLVAGLCYSCSPGFFGIVCTTKCKRCFECTYHGDCLEGKQMETKPRSLTKTWILLSLLLMASALSTSLLFTKKKPNDKKRNKETADFGENNISSDSNLQDNEDEEEEEERSDDLSNKAEQQQKIKDSTKKEETTQSKDTSKKRDTKINKKAKTKKMSSDISLRPVGEWRAVYSKTTVHEL